MSADWLQTFITATDNPMLGVLLMRVRETRALNTLLASTLPEEQPVLRHCLAVRSSENTLTLIAENPHWATRIRFLTPKLLQVLQQHPEYRTIQHIISRVNPPLHAAPAPANRRKMQISCETGKLLRETASKIEDAAIKKALENLAEKAK